jgi:hypothetical protein
VHLWEGPLRLVEVAPLARRALPRDRSLAAPGSLDSAICRARRLGSMALSYSAPAASGAGPALLGLHT